MDRREFVNNSLVSAGCAAMWPMQQLGQEHATAEAAKGFQRFVATKRWDFGAATEYLDSLGNYGCDMLRAVMSGDNPSASCLAVCMAKQLGSRALPLLPELVALAQDEEAPDSFRAVIAIGKIGPAAVSAVPILERRLSHPDRLMQLDAANSLVEIQPDRIGEWASVFHSALSNFDVAFRACSMVGQFGDHGHRFVRQLELLVADTSVDLRPDLHCEAARAIYQITGSVESKSVQRALQTERKLLASPDERVRKLTASRPICEPDRSRNTE